ncbi:uncharacterized protein MONOS_17747 [Monocercomonoides exilis]|uniref:uncharacterized protein n=1 Tax=Monocercomonoides exilis TaxID=2049356 RepID=UPI003559EE97|nr:hypothetical protein MONOS_17747 [Monocercomonoides exilis]
MSSYDVLSEMLSRELELLHVVDCSITFDSSVSDTSETSGRSDRNIDGNEDDEEVFDEDEEEEEDEDMDDVSDDEDSLDLTQSADALNANKADKAAERKEDSYTLHALRFTPKQRKTLSSESKKRNQKKSHVTFSHISTISSGELSSTPLQFTFPSPKSTKENGEKEEYKNTIGSDGSREALQSPRRRHINHSLAAVSVLRRNLVLSAIRAALRRELQEHLRAAAENGFAIASSSASLSNQTGYANINANGSDGGGVDDFGIIILFGRKCRLKTGLEKLFCALATSAPKFTTIPSSHAGETGKVLANDANSFLSLLCGTRLFSLGGEDTVRDMQLVENMRKEMNVWRGEGRTAVEGGDEARGTVELF